MLILSTGDCRPKSDAEGSPEQSLECHHTRQSHVISSPCAHHESRTSRYVVRGDMSLAAILASLWTIHMTASANRGRHPVYGCRV